MKTKILSGFWLVISVFIIGLLLFLIRLIFANLEVVRNGLGHSELASIIGIVILIIPWVIGRKIGLLDGIPSLTKHLPEKIRSYFSFLIFMGLIVLAISISFLGIGIIYN